MAVAGPRSARTISVVYVPRWVLTYQDHKPLLLRDMMLKEVHLEPGDEEEVY